MAERIKAADFDPTKEPSWKPSELPLGFVCPAGGNSRQYETGGWRTERPIWDKDACSNCMMCWVYCPDSSILAKDGEMVGIDYDHCKGCGVCAAECRFDALKIVDEASAKDGE